MSLSLRVPKLTNTSLDVECMIISYFDYKTFFSYILVDINRNKACKSAAPEFMARYYQRFLKLIFNPWNTVTEMDRCFGIANDMSNNLVHFDKLIDFICYIGKLYKLGESPLSLNADAVMDMVITVFKKHHYMYKWDKTKYRLMTYKMLQLYVEYDADLVSHKSSKDDEYCPSWLNEHYYWVNRIVTTGWRVKWFIHDFICKSGYMKAMRAHNRQPTFSIGCVFTNTNNVVRIMAKQVHNWIISDTNLWRQR